ncbi:MAG TPA: TPM domain-containing protein [Pyrinomonadaceae bacterium]|nr:TPM domain-containing protein [Pyrinomonadaceae bacterium]
MTKRIFPGWLAARTLLLACFVLAFAGAARAQNARAYTDAPLPKPDGFYKYVTDNANVLDPATKEKLATILNRLKERADIEFAVVTVPTTGDKDIFDYSLSIARGWGIGSKEDEKNGLLLVVAVNDRKWRVQVSRHLEGDMTDGLSGEIARQRLVPPFKQNDYNKGISDFVQAMVATLAEKRGFQLEGIDQSYAYRAPVQRTRTRTRTVGTGSGIGIGGCCLIAIVLIFILSAFGGRRGGGGRGGWGGGGGGGWLTSILVANAIGSALGGGRRSSSGWGGGGGSGWGGGGGGGGGFGGFGGGGDFGGGGSGGSW